MSETKLPDIVEQLERYGHLTLPETMALLDEQAAEITRLRSHAGWHEAIEEAVDAVCGWAANEHKGDDVDLLSLTRVLRALLPPGGEKG